MESYTENQFFTLLHANSSITTLKILDIMFFNKKITSIGTKKYASFWFYNTPKGDIRCQSLDSMTLKDFILSLLSNIKGENSFTHNTLIVLY